MNSLITFHKPRKCFGQHFLRDQKVLYHMIQLIRPQLNDHMVEIGAGEGVLTALLQPLVHQLDSIEIDQDLILFLKNRFQETKNVTIHPADALQFDFIKLRKNFP